MTTDTDKLIQVAEAAGFRVVRFNDADAYACDDEGKDITPQLAAFASAHIASLCGDVEPVAYMWQHDETGRIGFVEHAPAEELEQWERINRPRRFVAKLYPASTVAALKAERDAALARVAELEKDAARYRWLRRGQKWSVVDGIGTVLRADELDAAIDAALTKGQLAPQPQQEQSK